MTVMTVVDVHVRRCPHVRELREWLEPDMRVFSEWYEPGTGDVALRVQLPETGEEPETIVRGALAGFPHPFLSVEVRGVN